MRRRHEKTRRRDLCISTKKDQTESNHILLIDDREDFLNAARKTGWQTFLFDTKNRNTSIEELKKFIESI